MTRDGSDDTARARLMARPRHALLRNDLAALREVARELRALGDRAGRAHRRGTRIGPRCHAPDPDPPDRAPAHEPS